uniref:Uncharacterized protein n=1 Tax=Trichinella nativa TaxID=6335 RepID=A0A0V1KH14_9BILA
MGKHQSLTLLMILCYALIYMSGTLMEELRERLRVLK